MRDWIARHPFIFCFTVFGAMMLALKFAAQGAIAACGVWIAIPFFFACLAIGRRIDLRDRQRG